VEGNFNGEGSWYPGIIDGVRDDGTYDILYDDGDVETNVKEHLIRGRAAVAGTREGEEERPVVGVETNNVGGESQPPVSGAGRLGANSASPQESPYVPAPTPLDAGLDDYFANLSDDEEEDGKEGGEAVGGRSVGGGEGDASYEDDFDR